MSQHNLITGLQISWLGFWDFGSLSELIHTLNHVQSNEFAKGSRQVLEISQDKQSKQDAPELNLECLSQGSEYFYFN